MRAIALLLDILICGLSLLAGWIGVTGGGVFVYSAVRVTARSVDNPLLILAALLALRYWMRQAGPFLAVNSWPVGDVDRQAGKVLMRLETRLETITPGNGSRVVVLLIGLAVAVKTLMAWTSPGFFSGDDVEVQEMSLRALLHTDWPIWDLRNATFPLGFVYPMQRLAAALGATRMPALVFAGRLSVVLLSSVGIWLIWRAGLRAWPSASGWALASAFLLATNKLHMAFGASELPRPVSTLFVVGAFLAIQSRRGTSPVFAGALLGMAACFRFSEAVFLVPAGLQLVLQGRWSGAVSLLAAGAVTIAIVLGLTDSWYWGEAFHSLRAAVDYTLVQRLSSRGYQGVAWYILHSPQWINPAIFACALCSLFGSWRRPSAETLWVWVPLAILSALPHKEARYAIPIVPFACLAAVGGLRQVLARPRWPSVVLAALLLGLAHDAGHWRLPRTNSDVGAAEQIAELVPPGEAIAVEQAWRMGGHLYLAPHAVVDLDPQLLTDVDSIRLRASDRSWVALDSGNGARPSLESALVSRGYRAVTLTGASTYRLWRPPTGPSF